MFVICHGMRSLKSNPRLDLRSWPCFKNSFMDQTQNNPSKRSYMYMLQATYIAGIYEKKEHAEAIMNQILLKLEQEPEKVRDLIDIKVVKLDNQQQDAQ